jgi:dinuclear metal center YbgI/SA1388 family protein
MIHLKKLRDFLDALLPGNEVTDYCPNGLQIEGKEKVTKLATGVSADLATLEAAVEMGADALIVHHGLFWQRDSYVIESVKRKKIALLIENNISLFAYHLPLDLHSSIGNNWKAARDLGWEDLEPFGNSNGVCIGVKGKVPSLSREAFKQRLEEYYQHEAFCALGGVEQIKTAALISGGAHKSIEEAIKEGVDAFITGSFDEPVWHQANEGKINFFALGHSATERVGPQALAHYLEQVFAIPTVFIDSNNPF